MMKWFKRLLVALMLLVLLAITSAYLTPLDVYVPEIEQRLTANLGEPVEIEHLKLGVWPVPHLTLEGVKIGAKPDVDLQSAQIFFDLRSLLKPRRVIHRIELRQGVVTHEYLLKLMGFLQSNKAALAALRVDEIQFAALRVDAPGVTAPLEGKIELDAHGLNRVWMATADRKIVAQLIPLSGETMQVAANVQDWSPPGYGGLVLDSLSVSGVLSAGQFSASKFSLATLGLHASGMADLTWQPEWRLSVLFDEFDGELGRLLPLWDKRIEASGLLHGRGRLEAKGGDRAAWADSVKFDAELQVKHAALQLTPEARQKLRLDSVQTHASGTWQKVRLDKVYAQLYGGTLRGNAQLLPKEAALSADVSFGNIAVQPLVVAFNDQLKLTGRLNGQANLSAKLDAFDSFPANLLLDGSFMLKNGVLGKIDLVNAASSPVKGGDKGGETSFDELSGLLSVDGSGYHFKELKISSGALHATGKLDVSPQLQLNGLLDTDLKGTATLISMPLVVSGTVSAPVLRPAGSVLAGAAVGTALLGPGLGTALGIKIGNLLNKLFGMKGKQAPPAGPKGPAPAGQQNK